MTSLVTPQTLRLIAEGIWNEAPRLRNSGAAKAVANAAEELERLKFERDQATVTLSALIALIPLSETIEASLTGATLVQWFKDHLKSANEPEKPVQPQTSRYLAPRPWRVGTDDEACSYWTDAAVIIDAHGGVVAVLSRGYQGDENGDGCPSYANAQLIVDAVNGSPVEPSEKL